MAEGVPQCSFANTPEDPAAPAEHATKESKPEETVPVTVTDDEDSEGEETLPKGHEAAAEGLPPEPLDFDNQPDVEGISMEYDVPWIATLTSYTVSTFVVGTCPSLS